MKEIEQVIAQLPPIRRKPVALLKAHLTNPGRFLTLVIGDRGTGKQHWINAISDNNTQIVKANLAEDTSSYWDELMKKAHQDQKILVIKDVEFLSRKSQILLFECLSTTNGCFGIKDKKYEVRLVFTSSLSIQHLRDTEKYLYHYFFDRIAQLVVKFPNFNDYGTRIVEDFGITWKKFRFNSEKPNLKVLELWLERNAHRFYGNFRDLDKICINWENYRRMGKAENDIMELVKNDFKNYYHFPEKQKYGTFTYDFEEELTYKELIKNFKKQLKDWALDKAGDKKKAAQKLGISYRTLEGWN